MSLVKLKSIMINLSLILILSGCFFSAFSQDLASAIKLTTSEQYDAADQMYKALIQKDPANAEYYYYYGENFLKNWYSDSFSNDFNSAAKLAGEQFQKGISVNPMFPFNYVGIGKIKLLKGDTAGASAEFAKARAFLPLNPKKLKTLSPSKQAMVSVKIAEAYIISDINDTNKTLPILRRAAYLDPRNPEVYMVTGDAYLEINDGSKAMENYKKAYTYDPRSAAPSIRIGKLYRRSKIYNDALTYFKDAIVVDTNFAPAYRELAEMYALAGRYQEALKTYDKFLALSTNNLIAKIRYIKFLFMAKEYQQVIDKTFEVQKIDTSDNILNRLLAYSYYELNQPEKALFYINKFFSKAPPPRILVSDYSYFGKIYGKLKMDSLAIEKYILAYKLDTTLVESLSDLVAACNKAKNYNLAAIYAEKKLNLQQPGSDAWMKELYSTGRAYYNAKDYKKADTIFAQLIQAQPSSVQAWRWRALTNVQVDSTSKLGLAKPYYTGMVNAAMADSAKYAKDLAEAFSYFAFYHFKQFNLYKKQEDAGSSAAYCQKVLAITPNDVNAKKILDALKGKY